MSDDRPVEGDDSRSASDLGNIALSGARAVMVGRIAAESLMFAGSIVLARLVDPAEFGRAAVGFLIIALAGGITGQGVGSALVQMKTMTPAHVRTGLTLSVIYGLAGFALILVISPLLALAFDDQTVELIRIAGFAFVLGGAAAIPQSQLQRRLDFNYLTLVEVAASIGGVLTSIVLAVLGLEATALIIGMMSTVALTALLGWLKVGLVKPSWDRQCGREIASFGLPAAMASLSFTANRQIDYAILGSKVGPVSTGLYWRAYQLGVEYQSKISGILLRVAFPLFSRARDPGVVRELRARIVRLHAVVLFPLLGTLIVVAPTLVPWLYGAQWEDAGPMTQILAVAGMSTAIATGTGPLVMATGHPKAMRNYNMASLVAFSCVVFFFAQYGIITVCVAVTVYRILSLIASQYFLVQRLVGIPLRETLANDALPAGVATAVLVGVGYPVMIGCDELGLPPVASLPIVSIVCLGAYAVALSVGFPSARDDVVRLARRVLPSRRKPEATATGTG
jgi:PST family polysaccharide transporter